MGADIGILSGRTESPIAVGDRIKSVLGPDGPSVVIDCAGFEATMQVCCAADSVDVGLSSMRIEDRALCILHACSSGSGPLSAPRVSLTAKALTECDI